jgi:hypothetical protein
VRSRKDAAGVVGRAGFVDDHQGRRSDRCRPVRKVAVIKGPGEFGEDVGADTGLLGEDGGRSGRRGQAEHLAASLGPGHSEGAHGGGLAAPAGAIASCSRAPEAHICRTSAACPPPGRCR